MAYVKDIIAKLTIILNRTFDIPENIEPPLQTVSGEWCAFPVHKFTKNNLLALHPKNSFLILLEKKNLYYCVLKNYLHGKIGLIAAFKRVL